MYVFSGASRRHCCLSSDAPKRPAGGAEGRLRFFGPPAPAPENGIGNEARISCALPD